MLSESEIAENVTITEQQEATISVHKPSTDLHLKHLCEIPLKSAGRTSPLVGSSII